jgi:hypothetical protein
VRVLGALLGGQVAVRVEDDAGVGLPHIRRARARAVAGADERDANAAERGELARLLLQPVLPLGERVDAQPAVGDEPHGDLAPRHLDDRPLLRFLAPSRRICSRRWATYVALSHTDAFA